MEIYTGGISSLFLIYHARQRADNNCTHIESTWSELLYSLIPCQHEHSLCILPVIFLPFISLCFSPTPHLKISAVIIVMGMLKGKTKSRIIFGYSMIWMQSLMLLNMSEFWLINQAHVFTLHLERHLFLCH